MRLPRPSEFAQLRRGLPALSAVLLVGALALPMWAITVHAVQYPGEPLHLELYAYPHIAGDYWEMAELNQYIGFYFPDPVYWQPNYEVHPRAVDVPEWSLGPLAFIGVAATGLIIALAPTVEKLKRGLKWQLAGAVTVFAVMVADIQYRLYQAGHTLDPDAPVMGVPGFTPPLWGKYEVANITSYSRFGLGVYVTMLAVGLLVIAYRCRNTNATFVDIPRLVAARIHRERSPASDDDRRTEEDRPTTEVSGR